jgi:hypothetical protein
MATALSSREIYQFLLVLVIVLLLVFPGNQPRITQMDRDVCTSIRDIRAIRGSHSDGVFAIVPSADGWFWKFNRG